MKDNKRKNPLRTNDNNGNISNAPHKAVTIEEIEAGIYCGFDDRLFQINIFMCRKA